MLGSVVCTGSTWLRSCSKDLSPDRLIDPELVSATLTRADTKHQFYSEGNSHYSSLYSESQDDVTERLS